MGTHALIFLKERINGKEVSYGVLYIHWDGYIEGLGKQLYLFLKRIKITRGIAHGAKMGEVANGAGCLFTQLIAKLKTDVGNCYLAQIDSDEADYIYEIMVEDEKIFLSVGDFKGTVDEFGEKYFNKR